MNKVVLISDLHFGVHKNSDIFLNNQVNYFNNEFIPYLLENKIEKIFILGDVFDNRSAINVKVQNECLNFFKRLDCHKIRSYILIGNHDCYYTDQTKVNSVNILREFEFVTIIDNIDYFDINGKKLCLASWQTNNDFIPKLKKSDICFGHFDIVGFNFSKYRVSEIGINAIQFTDYFKLVFSGHYHTRSIKEIGNTKIIYLGAPYHITRNDIDELKGFCVLDLDTLEYEFIDSKNTIKFVSLKYPNVFTEELVQNNIVDIEVDYNESYNDIDIQKYIKKIELFKPVITPKVKVNNKFVIDSDISKLDTLQLSVIQLIHEYLNIIEIKDKEIILNILTELYNECKDSVI